MNKGIEFEPQGKINGYVTGWRMKYEERERVARMMKVVSAASFMCGVVSGFIFCLATFWR